MPALPRHDGIENARDLGVGPWRGCRPAGRCAAPTGRPPTRPTRSSSATSTPGSPEQLIADGYDAAVVRRVLQRVDDAELERRQIPPGVRITQRSFGRDLRMPSTNAWRPFGADVAETPPGQG